MIELFEKSGSLTLGSRLRWLAEELTRDAAEIYRMYGLEIRPKWFPVLYMLYYGTDNSVTGIAKAIGQTHPSVSTIVREMKTAGLVSDSRSEDDRRATAIHLTKKGEELKEKLKLVCDDVRMAVAEIEEKTANSLWDAITDWETALSEKSFAQRVADSRKRKGARHVEIVGYAPEYHMAFKRLNIMWINSHWSLEAHDLEVLDNPERSILSHGGHILVALVNDNPVGVVALCRMEHPEYDYEIAKLAVDPEARGAGIGDLLFRTAIEKAKALGARKLFLESNTLLKPAIALYRKYGFTELQEYHPAYTRGDIQMELSLSNRSNLF